MDSVQRAKDVTHDPNGISYWVYEPHVREGPMPQCKSPIQKELSSIFVDVFCLVVLCFDILKILLSFACMSLFPIFFFYGFVCVRARFLWFFFHVCACMCFLYFFFLSFKNLVF